MNETLDPKTPLTGLDSIGEVSRLVQRINAILEKYSDKDWNYSRIRLITAPVLASGSPYLLGCELIDLENRKGDQELKDVQNEVVWGDHHSSELGILEIISLRLNKALLAVAGPNSLLIGDPPRRKHPVLRLVKRSALLAANTPMAMWYEMKEVSGEEFENR